METFLAYLNEAPGTVLPGLMFYVLAIVLLYAGVMVITARNPVHSVLFLILAFFNAAGLFLLLGAEFIAMLLVIVYVGAVAVLFLFVVMMLDIDFEQLRKGFVRNLPLGLLAGVVLAAQGIMFAISWSFAEGAKEGKGPTVLSSATNTEQIGQVLYTHYMLPFQVAGLVLLVAMIGAIVLTHRGNTGVKRQKVAAQNSRRPADVLKLNSVNPGEGV